MLATWAWALMTSRGAIWPISTLRSFCGQEVLGQLQGGLLDLEVLDAVDQVPIGLGDAVDGVLDGLGQLDLGAVQAVAGDDDVLVGHLGPEVPAAGAG